MELRDLLIFQTHGSLINNNKFFKNKSDKFYSYITFHLEPINLISNEVLYSQGDEATKIYFISEGKVKLFLDLYEYIKDDELIEQMDQNERAINK